MKNIVHFLSKSKLSILAILVLLCIQAYCDLALPSYTSDILNVGLQQNGIEDAVPDTIQEDSLATLELFLSDEDAAVVDGWYSQADENGIRTLASEAANDNEIRSELNDLLMVPECIVYEMSSSEDTAATLEQLQTAISSGMMTKEQLQEQMASAMDELEDMTDTYLSQIAVYYVSAEYEAQGVNMNALRNSYLWSIGLKMLAMALVMMAVSILTDLLASVVASKIGRGLRQAIYEKVMAFTNAEMEQFSTASLITRSTNDIQQVQMVTVMLLRMVAYAPILAIAGIIKVVQTAAGMGWIIVLAVVVLAACMGILFGIAMPKFRQIQKKVDRLNLIARELLTGIMPIRAFSREKHEEARFEEANHDLYKTQLFTNRTMTFMTPVMMFVMNGVSVLIIWVGAHYVDAGTMQVGDMTAFITYSMVIVMGFMMIGMISIMLPRAAVAADRIVEVIETPVTLSDPDQPQDAALSNANGVLAFNDVSFCYPGADEPAIEHITFTAEPGKTTAIIGSTGCGKSTLLNLIPRFYDVTEGSITLDGVDIRQISQHRLRELLGYVPQKGVLFSGTIESNLKYGGPQITDQDMTQAADIAQATEFISGKAEGYQAPIAQGGSNVSGGQKQRLSIARAIAKHPKVFLFDDSFSALDYKTDLTLRKALATQTRDASVIIVAQRISTILHADQIIVLDEGKIVGMGTHEELLNSCGTYQEIARSQLSDAELAGIQKGGEA
ncbi:MAG: ABC transporter ATP-binding protein/permease [Oscillospiraceae bacterium]|nr:ABC transporter ATP-binding protein/permease [Oscillospiraceae bacterium]